MRVKSNNPQVEKALNTMLEYVEGFAKNPEISMGKGVFSPHTDGDHVVIESRGGRGGSGGGKRVWNLKVTGKDGRMSVTVLDGLLNNIFPSNSGEPISLTNGDNYVVAKGRAAGATIESAVIEVSRDQSASVLRSTPETAPPDVSVLIAKIVVDQDGGTRITRLRYQNVICTPVESFREGKEVTSPGGESFTRFYHWEVSDPDIL